MKLYLVERTDRIDYDEFDSWVVVANSTNEAAELTKYETVTVNPIGEAFPEQEVGIVLGSFNAG